MKQAFIIGLLVTALLEGRRVAARERACQEDLVSMRALREIPVPIVVWNARVPRATRA